jgi:hypothetical protein
LKARNEQLTTFENARRRIMVRTRGSVALAVAATAMIGISGISGCESDAKTGALIGTVIGAAAGAAINHDNRGRGAAIGAAGGALGGYIVGNESDKSKSP